MQSRLFELTHEMLADACRIIVAGDIHGDWKSCNRICELFDPIHDYLIFLGDYADRGEKGIEVIDRITDLVDEYPTQVIPLKGNHEDYSEVGEPFFTPSNLMYEARKKKGGWTTYFWEDLKPFLDQLYLAVLIPTEILFVHGGISSKLMDLDDLRYPSRSVEMDILWSDPFEGEGELFNVRGVGVEFGRTISEEICERLKVKKVVRSHQPGKAQKGPFFEHDSRIITISSTEVYGGKPFILSLPTNNLSDAFDQLGRNVIYLR
jgi:hypothetical protein